jgi:hypothetical protein
MAALSILEAEPRPMPKARPHPAILSCVWYPVILGASRGYYQSPTTCIVEAKGARLLDLV